MTAVEFRFYNVDEKRSNYHWHNVKHKQRYNDRHRYLKTASVTIMKSTTAELICKI